MGAHSFQPIKKSANCEENRTVFPQIAAFLDPVLWLDFRPATLLTSSHSTADRIRGESR
jgi:hypothetical protein